MVELPLLVLAVCGLLSYTLSCDGPPPEAVVPVEPSRLLELECAAFLGFVGNEGKGLSQATVSGDFGVSMIL